MATLTDIIIDKEIDARGSFCPGPLMELIRGMKVLPDRRRPRRALLRSRLRERHSRLDRQGRA